MTGISFENTIYNRPAALLSALGSFWASTYEGHEQIASFVAGKASVEKQSENDFFELLNCLSRYTTPIYHRDLWYKLVLKQSELSTAPSNLTKYDEAVTYNGERAYDRYVQREWYFFPLDETIKRAGIVVNRFTEPSLIWTSTNEYAIEPGGIAFASNPFDDARVAKRPVFKDGVVIDYEAVLWLFNCDQDFDILYRQYGYVIGMKLASSIGYRTLLNSFFDALVGGMSELQHRLAFSAMTGIPLVKETRETVEDLVSTPQEVLIITDQHVYKFHPQTIPTVAIGDVVARGDTLTNALQFWNFNRGVLPDDIKSLALGRGQLYSCFYSDLVFINKDVPLVVDTAHPSGYTKVSFQLGGLPQDVTRFFDELHERGVAAAQAPVDQCDPGDVYYTLDDTSCDSAVRVPKRRGTLAHILDKRVDRVGEPTAASLPTTINPLEFLVQYVFRGNGCAVKVQTSRIGNDAVGLFNVKLLQKLVPPHVALFLILEMTASQDSVTTARVNADTVSIIPGMEPGITAVGTGFVQTSSVKLRAVSGKCL
jgi:hypothetical protein